MTERVSQEISVVTERTCHCIAGASSGDGSLFASPGACGIFHGRRLITFPPPNLIHADGCDPGSLLELEQHIVPH